MVRTILHVDRQRVLPRRRDGRIEDALGDDLEPRMLGGSTVLRVQKRVLHIIDRGSDVRASPMMRSGRLVGRRPTRELGQRAVDFHRGPVHLDRADGTPEFRGHVIRFDQLQERAFRIRGRDDRLGVDRSATFESNSDRASFVDTNPLDRGAKKDFDAAGPRSGREGIGQRAHSAQHETPAADLAVDVPEEVVREGERGPRRRRTGEMADHAFVREGGLDLVRLEVFVEEFFRAVEQQAPEEVLGFRTAEERNQFGDRDRRGEEHRLDEIVDLGPHRLVLRIRGGVLFREFRDLLRGLLAVGPEEEKSSIRKRAEALRVEGHLPQPELGEFEVLNDLRPEQSRHVRRGADLESWRDFVRDARAADAIRPLDDDHSEARLRQIVRGDQAVVARPDDHDIQRDHRRRAGTSGLVSPFRRRTGPSVDSASLAYRRRSRGFTTSSSPKPTIANPRTTKVIANPGGKKYHHIGGFEMSANEVYAWLTIVPQLTVAPEPGGGPRPKKERNASVNTALEIVRTASAQTSGMTFGRTCFQMMYGVPATAARARSMKSRSFTVRTWLRITRAVVGQLTTAIAMIVVCRLGPSTKLRTIANGSHGMTRKKSVARART